MSEMQFRIDELEAENQELADENERLVEENERLVEEKAELEQQLSEVEGYPGNAAELQEQNLRLVESLRSYMGKFGDCGPVYEEAAALLAELKGE